MICRAYQRQPGLRQPLGHCRHTSSALGSADTGGPRSFSRNSRSKGEPRGRRCRCRGAGCVSCPRAPRLRSALWAPGISISLSITACWIGAVSLSAQRMRWLPEAQCQLPSYRAACLAQSWPCRDPALHVRGSQRLAQGLLQGGIRSHSQRGLCLLPPGSLASGPPPPACPPSVSLVQVDSESRGRAAAPPGNLVGLRRACRQQPGCGLSVRVCRAQLLTGKGPMGLSALRVDARSSLPLRQEGDPVLCPLHTHAPRGPRAWRVPKA